MKRRPIFSRSIWIGVLFVLPAAGCVHRQLIIQSEPPGAVVEVNGQRISPAPADYTIKHYGTHRIRLQLPGYETAVIDEPIKSPWYEWPGLDFVSENLIPFTISDVRRRTYVLHPMPIVPAEAVLDRSEQFRQRGRSVGMPPMHAPIPGEITPGPPAVSGFPPPIPGANPEPLPPPTLLPPKQ